MKEASGEPGSNPRGMQWSDHQNAAEAASGADCDKPDTRPTGKRNQIQRLYVGISAKCHTTDADAPAGHCIGCPSPLVW